MDGALTIEQGAPHLIATVNAAAADAASPYLVQLSPTQILEITG